MARVLHAVDERTVTARRLAEHGALRGAFEGAVAAFDLWDDLANQIVRVIPDGRGVDVLVAAEPGPAVGEHGDHRAHLPRAHQPLQTLGQTLLEGLPTDVRPARAEEADQVHEDGEAARGLPIVLRGQIDGHEPARGIAECVAAQHRRVERKGLDAAPQELAGGEQVGSGQWSRAARCAAAEGFPRDRGGAKRSGTSGACSMLG